MNLIIDAGNTSVKLAVFSNEEVVHLETVSVSLFVERVLELFKKHPNITDAIFSSVGVLNKEHLEQISAFCTIYELSYRSKFPFENQYATPKTLGVDRLALAAGAYNHGPSKNVLVIDAGTCITYDIVTEEKTYLGGAISPGIQMRYKAMEAQTSKLPYLSKEEPVDFVGNTTESSMHSGVVNGVIQEINGVITQYQSRFKNLTIILTGGDTLFLCNQLKNTIFADSKFLLKGLNYILEYNKH